MADDLGSPPGAIRGELQVYIADFDDGSSRELHFLRIGSDERNERPLRFDRNPDLPTGTRLDVWAVDEGDHLRVTRFERVPDPPGIGGGIETKQQALVNGPPYRPRRIAFVMVDVGGGINTNATAVATRLFGTGATDASLRQYYVEASFGRQDLGGDIFGPFQYTMNGCDTRGLATAIRAMVPTGYDHYLWYMGSRVSACSWTGLASTGSPATPSRDTWYNGSTNCVVLVQEPGHNFGMKHSSSMKCGTSVFNDVPMGNCVHSEYGDPYDPMGRACRHMNSYQKAYQGWFGGCNMVDVTSSGTFTLLPIELPCNGVQVLQIPMPKTRPFYREGGGGQATTINISHYYVELRTSQGFDRGFAAAPMVQIRVSGDVRLRTQGGINTWILDMNPATTAFEGLGAGGTFTDPANTVKITVEAIDATKATVRVDIEGGMGAPTCLDGTMLPAPAPGPESCAQAPAMAGSAPPVLPPLPDGGARGDVVVRAPIDVSPARPSDAVTVREDAAPAGRDGGGMMGNDPNMPNVRSPDAGELAMGAQSDGGAGPRPGSGAGGGGAGGQAPEGDKLEDAGCGCRVGGRGQMPAGGALVLALIVACAGAGRARRARRRCGRGAAV